MQWLPSITINNSVFNLWDSQETNIAQLEPHMVFQSLITFPSAFRNATGVYFIDNVASLMALVSGRSDRPEFDIIAQCIHLLLFGLRCSLWLEWIPSKSNWSNASSCKGFLDPWFASDASVFTSAQLQFCYETLTSASAPESFNFSADWHSLVSWE